MIRSAATISVGRFAGQAIALAAAPVLTRLFLPAQLGSASVAVGILVAVGTLSCLRFELALPLAEDREVADVALVSGAAAGAVALVLAAVIAAGGDSIAEAAGVPQLAGWFWLVPLHVLVAAAALIATAALVRAERYGILGLTRLSQATAATATQLAGGAVGLGAPVLIVASPVGVAASAAVAAAAARRSVTWPRCSTRGAVASFRRYRRFAGLSTLAAGFAGASTAALPILIVAAYGAPAAGLFVLASRLVQAPLQEASAALTTSAFASAARGARMQADLRHMLRRLTFLLVAAGLPILLLIFLIIPPLFGSLFGSEWERGEDLIGPLAAAQLGALISIPSSQTLQALKRPDVQAVVSLTRFVAAGGALLLAHAFGGSFVAACALYASAMIVVSSGQFLLADRTAEAASRATSEARLEPGPAHPTRRDCG